MPGNKVILMTTLGFYSLVSSIESMELLERPYELVASLSVEVFPGALKTKQKIGGWREILEKGMNLKGSEGGNIDLLARSTILQEHIIYAN